MALTLYAHPFSSYCQKVLTALYEYELDFEFRMLSPENPDAMAELEALWPFMKFPVLVDDGARGEHHHRAPGAAPRRG